MNISSSQSVGTCWFQVPPPDGVQLRQISVGLTHVYAVDSRSKYACRYLIEYIHDSHHDFFTKIQEAL